MELEKLARSHCGNVRRELLRRGRLKLRELDVSGVHLGEAATKRMSAGDVVRRAVAGALWAEEVDRDPQVVLCLLILMSSAGVSS